MTTMNTQKEYEVLKEERDRNFEISFAPYFIIMMLKEYKDLDLVFENVDLPESFVGDFKNIIHRRNYTKYYSWAIPDRKAIQAIINFYESNKINYILEIGAGFGLWAGMLSIAGVAIKATDIDPTKNLDEFIKEPYADVETLPAVDSVEKYNDADCLFICWPEYNKSYAADALSKFSGKYIVYIGENAGGCTANDEFFDILEKDWTCEQTVDIKNWWGIHDRMVFYVRN